MSQQSLTLIDTQLMTQCLALASLGVGHASPNPMVGCLLVDKNKNIIAQGYHHACGQAHAERDAFFKLNAQATTQKEALTAYINLEPCAHYGRQPPCVDLLIEHKVKRVVIPFADPDRRVSGLAIQKLREHHIEVTTGILMSESFELNQDFFKHKLLGRPLVSAKWAASLDGKIATTTGESQWISNSASRKQGHQLRHSHQAILIGARTLALDNPTLDVRFNIEAPSNPTPIVVLGQNSVNLKARLFMRQTIIVTTADYAYPLPSNCIHVQTRTTSNNQVDLNEALTQLGSMGIISILVEGGGTLLSSLLQAGLVDQCHLFTAPLLIGGVHAKTAFEGVGFSTLAQATKLIPIRTTPLTDEQSNTDLYTVAETQTFYQWKQEAIQCLQALSNQ